MERCRKVSSMVIGAFVRGPDKQTRPSEILQVAKDHISFKL